MSFFKDFKADFTQAMNELMPDGNEMYEDDTELEDEVVATPKKEEKKPKKAKKTVSKSKETEQKVSASQDSDDVDIAPEDMSDQIDDLLNHELYEDNSAEDDAQNLIKDDMEVNTMDMSVEELLNQLSVQQKENKVTEAPKVAEKQEPEELSVDDLLSQLEQSIPEEKKPESTHVADPGLEELLNRIGAKNGLKDKEEAETITKPESEPEPEVAEEVIEQSEPEVIEEEVITEPEPEVVEEVIEQSEPEIIEEKVITEPQEVVDTQPEETAVADIEPEVTEPVAANDEQVTNAVMESAEDMIQTEKIDEVEEPIMSEEKEVTTIHAAEPVKTDLEQEHAYNLEDADTETTYITKGTKLTGDLETDGSVDVIGTIEGSVSCKGKVVVGGTVKGDITSGELYANGARIEGNIKSYGSVKVGVGSMIIGSIEGESAVIAGAVNGDIDVKGPVIVDSTAVIMGNIKSRSVQINNGAVIEGFCSQSYSDIDVKSFFA